MASIVEIGDFYALHASWLRNWLKRHTRCSHRAADLAQDTFCHLVESGKPVEVRHAKAYLATIARNILIDDIRHRAIERAYLEQLGVSTCTVDHLSPDRIVEAVQSLALVMRQIDSLPAKARKSFILIRFEGLRYAEAAARLQISERMVRRYVAQAYASCFSLACPADGS